MYVLLSYWNGKNSSKQKTVIDVLYASNDESSIIEYADGCVEEKLSLLDDEERVTTEIDELDPSDLFVTVAGDRIIYGKSAGPTGVNEWHFVIVSSEDDVGEIVGEEDVREDVAQEEVVSDIPELVLTELRKALTEKGSISEMRSIYLADLMTLLSKLGDESIVSWTDYLREALEDTG